MILAFQLSDLITVPFGWLLGQLYHLTSNYGVAMILFALIVQTVLLPIRAKSKKSMMKMSRLQPKIQELQRKYANDPQKQNQAIQELQREEGASLGCGGCLWSLVPLLILIPLFQVIREPIVYILGETPDTAGKIISTLTGLAPDLFKGNAYYNQVTAAQAISQYAAELKTVLPELSETTLAGINFSFLGIDLGSIPNWKFWAWDAFSWANIGACLVPIVSAGSQVLQLWVGQKSNDSVITDENGMKDEETAKNAQSAQSSKFMMWMMPILSLWIGFTVSAVLSLYWFVGGVYSMVTDYFMTKHFRKLYDAEDAERLARAMERDRLEAEKERLRAQRRAENPDGQTQNTSKKKLQRQQQAQEKAEKDAAAREYAAKHGVVFEEEKPENTVMSGIPSRPYCKGRNYDPNRYASNSTEE